VASGFGAASTDALYGTIAAAGLTLAADFLVRQQVWLGILGGMFLLYLGVSTFRSSPPETSSEVSKPSKLSGDYMSTLLLTLSNPITVFSFIALFGGLSAKSDFRVSAFLLVVGVFSGSAIWWLALSAGVSIFRKKFSPIVMQWVNRAAGLVILAFSVVMLWRALVPLVG